MGGSGGGGQRVHGDRRGGTDGQLHRPGAPPGRLLVRHLQAELGIVTTQQQQQS